VADVKAHVPKAFADLYRTMVVALQPRGLERDTMAVYWADLHEFTLDELTGSARTLRQRQPKGIWPTSAEWFQAAEEHRRRVQAGTLAQGDLRVMDPLEVETHRVAHRNCFDGEPCECLICQAAGVTLLRQRFVPEFYDDGEPVYAFNPKRKHREHLGHWAHGNELARWYLAREAFAAAVQALKPSPLQTAGALVLVPREPGQEG
jgi:hypothetical protein